RGVQILGPAAGDLASGRAGEGRMWDPERIAQTVLTPSDLSGLTMLVTAGPTWEPIDPVRVLTNRSTGAMGIAIAEAAARRGAHVRLVLGPTHLSVASSVDVTRVETANEMLKASKDKLSGVDVLVATAAVSDFRPSQPNASKLKRAESSASTLELVENPDILATLSPVLRAARPQATVVGFAAETEDVITHARGKMLRKGCDFVVGNLVGPGQGFGAGQTKVIAVRATDTTAFGPASKPDVAEFILDQVIEVRRQQVGS
ncbi:MAG: phosphopantothenoylcysteine decarboxylase, partial [Myxococcota bacterium]